MTIDTGGQLYQLLLSSPETPKKAQGRSLNVAKLAERMGMPVGRVGRMFIHPPARHRPPAADLEEALVDTFHLDPKAVTAAIDADFRRPRDHPRDELDVLVDGFRNQLRELFERAQA